MIENSFGKVRSVYIADTFGKSLKKFHFPEYHRLLNNMVAQLCDLLVKVDNAHSSLEVNVRRNSNSAFIYLINFTSEIRRPIQKILPCTNVITGLPINGKVKSIQSLCRKEIINFTQKNDSASFALAVAEDYEVLKIDQ
jgi:hypothetical protein